MSVAIRLDVSRIDAYEMYHAVLGESDHLRSLMMRARAIGDPRADEYGRRHDRLETVLAKLQANHPGIHKARWVGRTAHQPRIKR